MVINFEYQDHGIREHWIFREGRDHPHTGSLDIQRSGLGPKVKPDIENEIPRNMESLDIK